MNNSPSFIDEQHAARWLAKFALPFVAASTPEQIRHDAFTCYSHNVPNVWRGDDGDLPTPEVDFERYDIYRQVTNDELFTLQGTVKAMLFIVLSGRKNSELPPATKKQVAKIEREITKIANSSKYKAVWRGRGEALLSKEAEGGVILRLRTWFVQAITTCLYSSSLLKGEDETPIVGTERQF